MVVLNRWLYPLWKPDCEYPVRERERERDRETDGQTCKGACAYCNAFVCMLDTDMPPSVQCVVGRVVMTAVKYNALCIRSYDNDAFCCHTRWWVSSLSEHHARSNAVRLTPHGPAGPQNPHRDVIAVDAAAVARSHMIAIRPSNAKLTVLIVATLLTVWHSCAALMVCTIGFFPEGIRLHTRDSWLRAIASLHYIWWFYC